MKTPISAIDSIDAQPLDVLVGPERSTLRADLFENPPKVLRRNAVAERVGLTVRQIERLEQAGRFPAKVKLSDRACGWLEADVSAWIRARVAESLQR